jgi:SSS family solute:Na+ symporter
MVFLLDFTHVLKRFIAAYPAFEFLNFMVISFALAMICAAIMVVCSVLFPEPLTPEKKALVWNSIWEPLQGKGWPGLGSYKVLSAVLIFIMVALFWLFS